MAIAVFDDFTRVDNPTSLGTATTGQVWIPYDDAWAPGDTRWQIISNQAGRECGGNPSVGGGGYALVDSGLSDCIVKVTINNATFGGNLNNNNFGMIFRWEDDQNYILATWSRAGQFLRICRVKNGVTSCTNEGFPGPAQIQDGDVLEIRCCGLNITGYHNGVLTVTVDFGAPWTPLGTFHGLQCGTGVIDATSFALFDDFTVETNGTCTPTYNCTVDGCVDPGDGTGFYATLAACETDCNVTPSWNCVDGACVDPGDGTGTFPTLLACQQSGCAPHTATTEIFDEGEGGTWYVAPHITDSGDELRSKQAKSIYVVGRVTDCEAMGYAYDVTQPINVTDLEDGVRTNSSNITRRLPIPDTTEVTQSARKQINVVGTTTTCRISGDDTGQTERDRIDQITMEISQQGVRR